MRTTRFQAKSFLRAFGAAMVHGLKTSGAVSLRDFLRIRLVETRPLAERRGTNPFTKKPMVIRARPPGRKLKVKFTNKMKQEVGQIPRLASPLGSSEASVHGGFCFYHGPPIGGP